MIGTVGAGKRGQRPGWSWRHLALLLLVALPELLIAWLLVRADATYILYIILGLMLPLVLFVGLLYPNLTLTLAVASLPMTGIAINIGFGLEFSVLFSVVLFLGALLNRTSIPQEPRLVRMVNTTLACFMVAMLLSIAMSITIPVPSLVGQIPWLKSFKQFMAHVNMLIVYLAFIVNVRTEVEQARCYRVLLLSSLVVSWYGIYQFISFYFHLHLPWEVPPFGNVSLVGRHGIGWFMKTLPRISSVADEGPHFAAFLLIPILYLLAHAVTGVDRERWPVYRLLVYLLPMLAAFTFTFSRAPSIALVIGVGLILALGARVPVVRLVLIASALVTLLVLLVPDLATYEIRQPKAMSQVEYSNQDRLATYYTAISIFREYPLLGVGIGNYGFFYPSHKPEWAPAKGLGIRYWPTVHSVLLRYLVETGLIGFTLFILLTWLLLQGGYEAVSLSEAGHAGRASALGIFAGFVAVLVCLLFIEVMTWAFIWFHTAMVILSYRFAAQQREITNGSS